MHCILNTKADNVTDNKLSSTATRRCTSTLGNCTNKNKLQKARPRTNEAKTAEWDTDSDSNASDDEEDLSSSKRGAKGVGRRQRRIRGGLFIYIT